MTIRTCFRRNDLQNVTDYPGEGRIEGAMVNPYGGGMKRLVLVLSVLVVAALAVGSTSYAASDGAARQAAGRGVKHVPVPDEWGGFRVVPEAVEFWQGRPGRLHDRLVYRRTDTGWTTHRLAP